MPRFELNFLDENTDEALVTEIQRAAAMFNGVSLSKRVFNTLSGRVSASTICNRFGGWKEALEAAGVGRLYNGRPITEKMRKNRISREMSKADLVAELQRVRSIVGRDVLSVEEFVRLSVTGVSSIRGRFGTWQKACVAAGISQSNHAKRYSDNECFENLGGERQNVYSLRLRVSCISLPKFGRKSHSFACSTAGAAVYFRRRRRRGGPDCRRHDTRKA